MQTPVGIRGRIDHVYASLRPAERAVARFVRDHLDETADLTVGQLADASHVSQPTVIRFARKLGFGGYRELRYVLRHPESEHEVTVDPLGGFDLNPWDDQDDVPAKVAAGATELIGELRHALDPRAFRRACALLAGARLVDVYGVENSQVPAVDLYTKLSYLGLACRRNTDAYLQQIGAAHLTDRDVAIAFSHSGSSVDTVKALRAAKTAGARTIAVTNTAGAPLAAAADVTLLTGVGSHEIHGNAIFSRVANVALVDMLYMGVILADYGRFSTALDESGRMIRDRGLER
ncbi:MurR/RpiR family transcriptional regulator [Bifidobacterium pullorum subsp. saeculare]|uniref:MurR/RpiR family transcriptional regulator n=1 Tax=Bifidobacterium pullorum subsp. saeculare TaxID=78257 RepID=A0A938WVV5_9BIFI|nr:MurR/RpiR family transcriptional regulator [Bifidobacterium pullorum]MBM6698801.1 MurR/RpiR family transcriptional regulator [Bifidobacterium pullorum subsp. saeculare]